MMVSIANPDDDERGRKPRGGRAAASLLLTSAEVAEALRISERSLWRKVSSREVIAPVKMGGTTRWRRDELEAWVAAGCPASGK